MEIQKYKKATSTNNMKFNHCVSVYMFKED